LQQNVEDIEWQLRHVKDVAKITTTGGLSEEIGVYVDNNKLLQYGISSATIMQALQSEGAISAAGIEEGKIIDRPIHITRFFNTESNLAEHIIKADNAGIVRLRDVATIKREYEEPDSYVTANGTKSIIISLEMATGKNIVQFGEKIDEKAGFNDSASSRRYKGYQVG